LKSENWTIGYAGSNDDLLRQVAAQHTNTLIYNLSTINTRMPSLEVSPITLALLFFL